MSVLAALVLSVLPLPGAQDQPARAAAVPEAAGFRFVPGRIAPGRLYRYRKSNRDGSNASEIALYLAAEDRIESFKWHPEDPEATLVVAEMDWSVCSVKGFRTFKVARDGARTLVAELETREGQLVARLGESEVSLPLERFPWHSYDFDFASLNVALRFLADPEGEVAFAIVDPARGHAGIELRDKGEVFLSYAGTEQHAGLACRRYTIDGPGLEERGGSLWAASGDEVFLAGFEIDLPDEPGMRSGKLLWLENAELTPAEWDKFVVERTLPAR